MSFINCKNCGYTCSDQATACPRCGAPIGASNSTNKILTGIIILASIALIGAIAYLVVILTTDTKQSAEAATPAKVEAVQQENVAITTTPAPATGQQVASPNASPAAIPATPAPQASAPQGVYTRSFSGTVGKLGINMQLTFDDRSHTAQGSYRFKSGGANVGWQGSWNPSTGALELDHYKNGQFIGHMSASYNGGKIYGTVHDYKNNQVFTISAR